MVGLKYKWVALSVTTIGTLMAGVDARIIIVGLPTIARELGADAESVIWVSQAYLLASTIGLLLIGRVTDLIGRVKIYNYGFILFTIGSAFASLSISPGYLIASRIVQGTGSAMIITNSAAILTDATPKDELGTMLGINQVAFRIGSIAGLTLSGVIIAIADWRALFYINIPIGIFGTIWAHKRLREISTKDAISKMDWRGFLVFTSGLTMALIAITFLSYGSSYLPVGFGLLILGGALLIIFVGVERNVEAPLLDLKLFKIREFAGGTVAQLLNATAWSGIIISLSFYLQIIYGDSPLQAGLSLLPIEAMYLIFGPLSGKLSDKYGSRPFATLGLILSSTGFFLLAAIASPTTGFLEIAIVLALMGAGNGMFVSPNVSSIMASVPAHRRGVASGFRVTLFNVGLTASSGIAVPAHHDQHSVCCVFHSTSELRSTLGLAAGERSICERVSARSTCARPNQYYCDSSLIDDQLDSETAKGISHTCLLRLILIFDNFLDSCFSFNCLFLKKCFFSIFQKTASQMDLACRRINFLFKRQLLKAMRLLNRSGRRYRSRSRAWKSSIFCPNFCPNERAKSAQEICTLTEMGKILLKLMEQIQRAG